MCLLVVLSRVHPDAPLVVAANRDELLARPAEPMQVLRPASPRILGGRDALAGGTWLAVNQHGVVAALTNRPPSGGQLRDPARRSRGELPLLLAKHPTAAAAAAAFVRSVDTANYNACWLLVADRDAALYMVIDGAGAPPMTELPPGILVLENSPLEVQTPKTEAVRRALAPSTSWRGLALPENLQAVLSSHEIPPGAGAPDAPRPVATLAACVHAGEYGTRSSAVVIVGEGEDPPRVLHSDGPPCRTPAKDATKLWNRDA